MGQYVCRGGLIGKYPCCGGMNTRLLVRVYGGGGACQCYVCTMCLPFAVDFRPAKPRGASSISHLFDHPARQAHFANTQHCAAALETTKNRIFTQERAYDPS